MTDATLDTTGPEPAVRLERYLPDPPPVVWQAITERGQLKAWFPCDVIVEGGRWEVGAAIAFPFPPEAMDLTLTGTVLAVDEPKLLSYTWGEDEILRFELYPEPDAWRRRFDAYSAAFEPVIGPQEGPPAEYKDGLGVQEGTE